MKARTGTQVPPGSYNTPMPLGKGENSVPIKQKQWQLYYLGYYDGEMDGIWGKRSKDATVGFQKDNSLTADGVFGTNTIAKSIDITKAIQKEITDGKIAIISSRKCGMLTQLMEVTFIWILSSGSDGSVMWKKSTMRVSEFVKTHKM